MEKTENSNEQEVNEKRTNFQRVMQFDETQ